MQTKADILNEEECWDAVDSVMKENNYEEQALVEVLITAQNAYGFLPEDVLKRIAKKLRVPTSRVWSVATFYDMFKLEEESATECLICIGPACQAAGAQEVLKGTCKCTGVSAPGKTSNDGKYTVKEAVCLGLCDQAPAALVNGKTQVHLTPEDVPAMLRGEAPEAVLQVAGEPRILTAPIGRLVPTDLPAHRSELAFAALEKALHSMTPEEVIEEVKDARLAGRGGANYLAGLKWQHAHNVPSDEKFIVCNFDESEPGTFKDRILMEGNPFRPIEGLIIGGYAVGAQKGFIFVRGEYQKAADTIQTAIAELYKAGLLGKNILGSGFSFDIEIRHNAGAYVCGEETALFEAIEGKRGYPRNKPPYPTQSGLFNKPTVINNVETLAFVPSLILNGGEWLLQWGTAQSVGLKLFCLSGDVKQPGVVEVPYGITVRELVERYGGGFDGEPQAILIGGAAGGFLNPHELDIPLTNETLAPLEIPVGSGAIVVFNQSVNLWEVLEGLAQFFEHETCGQCVPCRLGTKQICTLLHKINTGTATFADVRKLEELGQVAQETCLCGLGKTAVSPVLTYLHNIETIFQYNAYEYQKYRMREK